MYHPRRVGIVGGALSKLPALPIPQQEERPFLRPPPRRGRARSSYPLMEAQSPFFVPHEAARSPRHAVPARVALFTGAYNHIADGVSLTLNRLVDYLERHGVAVRVFAPTVEEPAVDHAGTLVPAPSVPAPGRPEYRLTLGLSRAVRDEVRRFDPTLFHIATPDVLGYQALRFARKLDVPVVASYHTHFSSYLKYYKLGLLEGVLWRYLRHFYAQCEQVYVPSPSMVAVLRENGFNRGLRLWERGVDTERFNPDRRSTTWRHVLGIEEEDVLITFVGRLVWEKGLELFASVLEGLEARGVRHRSMIVGDGPARAELERRLPRTTFTGHLGGEALPRAYASSDVFLFPSDTETFGNVTLEAMASGTPAVAADATGSNALVDHGVTGFLAAPGRAADFLDHTQRLVEDAALRYRMGCEAVARARHYEWDAVLGRIAGYYREVLNGTLAPVPSNGDGVGRGFPVPEVSPASLL